MKEANYNHLKLDNFTSFRSDFGGNLNTKKTRTVDYIFNKENYCPSNAANLSSPSSAGKEINTPGTCNFYDFSNVSITPTAPQKINRVPLSNISNTLNSEEGEGSNIPGTYNSYNFSNVSITPNAPKKMNRVPLSNISNTLNSEKGVQRKLNGTKSNQSKVSVAKPKNNSTMSSLISDDEDDLFWDDDTTFNDIPEGCISSKVAPADGYASLGAPTECCSKCHAIIWKGERVNKSVRHGVPKFSICCGQGQIKIPDTPPTPSYLMQLYNDRKKSNHFKRCIRLIKMLDETNQLVSKFRYARDRFEEQPIRDLRIKMKVCRSQSGRENNIGPSDEVAAVMIGDDETTSGERDIIIEKKNKDLERISTFHPSLMALQYPLLFPMGEDGYHNEIPYVDPENQNKKKRKRITMKEYYSYKLQVRKHEGMTPRLDDIKKKNYFGTCIGVMSVVELQKRGLPHVHMLIWLNSESKRNLTANIDKFVSAEIPDPEKDPAEVSMHKAFPQKVLSEYYV
ncbi:hypothetical protein POM88_033711 [Heracleum sosnowskyi]|uniref:Helitron helicase-like domain-containing protein n=1 Tax=Heracleum sosnowskyi TaxID=360622 RepID=A0AAD8HJV2_9APIA|nr:hypothetical protein POM88_033711 [Heracleum sosnowskyi]